MTSSPTDEREAIACPSCGRPLQRNEDPHGVTYQCQGHDCFEMYGADEVEPIHLSEQGEG